MFMPRPAFTPPRLMTPAGLAAHTLESVKPALRALIADSVARVPDYAPPDDAPQQVLDALAHAVDHALAHVPALALPRSLLLVSARQIVERLGGKTPVAALKAAAVDQMIVKVNSARA